MLECINNIIAWSLNVQSILSQTTKMMQGTDGLPWVLGSEIMKMCFFYNLNLVASVKDLILVQNSLL